MTSLPPDHPERLVLAEEVHARPPEALGTPERASYFAVLVDQDQRDDERAHVVALCERFDVAPPVVASATFALHVRLFEEHEAGPVSAHGVRPNAGQGQEASDDQMEQAPGFAGDR